jgi:hypothetical protein
MLVLCMHPLLQFSFYCMNAITSFCFSSALAPVVSILVTLSFKD